VETIQKYILDWSVQASDEDEFVDKLNELINSGDEKSCQAVLRYLTNLELSRGEAQKYWQETLAHRESLKNVLGRDVKLMTALCDYLSSQSMSFNSLKLVEISTFDKFVQKSTHDGLTGLSNRAYFSEAFEQQILLSKRHDTDLSVLFLDIDDFKNINDTYGHKSGDDVLTRVAEVIRLEARTSDVVSRYGGEEFVVLMPHTDFINAFVLAERIRAKVEREEIAINGGLCRLTVSGGIASFPIHATTAEDLLHLADSALYRAKGAGKNNISLFKEDKRRFLRTRLNREVKIKEVGFQAAAPILSGTSKDICIGGVLFENDAPLPIGAMIQVSIMIGRKEPTLLIGTVVRVEAFGPHSYDIGMSISFKEMEKTANDEISKFLLEHSEGHHG
jgi:diguanylate cyclase (GGDEF)-like protein